MLLFSFLSVEVGVGLLAREAGPFFISTRF